MFANSRRRAAKKNNNISQEKPLEELLPKKLIIQLPSTFIRLGHPRNESLAGIKQEVDALLIVPDRMDARVAAPGPRLRPPQRQPPLLPVLRGKVPTRDPRNSLPVSLLPFSRLVWTGRPSSGSGPPRES